MLDNLREPLEAHQIHPLFSHLWSCQTLQDEKISYFRIRCRYNSILLQSTPSLILGSCLKLELLSFFRTFSKTTQDKGSFKNYVYKIRWVGGQICLFLTPFMIKFDSFEVVRFLLYMISKLIRAKLKSFQAESSQALQFFSLNWAGFFLI